MKLETFFEKLDQFADTPDAVAKVRELVLELAVQGKLTQQLVGDDSVEKLLQEIHAEKVSLVNEGLLKKAERIEPLQDTLQLPSQWRHAPLAALCVSVTDGDHLPPPKAETGVPFLVISDVRWGGIDFTGCRRVSEEYFAKLDWIRKPQGRDILYTLVGSFGIPVVVRDSHPFCVQRHIGILRPSKHIELQYLAYALESKLVFRQAALVATGIAQKTVPLAGLRKIVIPLPPLAEQKRIVAKVDELMALCDRLEAQQQERESRSAALARASLARFADAPTPANLNFIFHKSYDILPADLRKSILTLAVQGKLVSQDPNDEPAEKILAGIAGDVAKAIRAKRMRNSRPIPEYEDEFPFDLPAGWAWAPLGTLTAAEDGAMCDGPFGSKLKTEHYIPTKGYAVLRLGNIGVGYFIHGKEGHIPREHFESLPSNHTAPGDLLVAGLADPLVRCCEIPPDIGPAVNKSDCFRVRLSRRIDRSYVRHYLNSPAAKAFAAEENHGMTRERINLANAKALPVSVPPLVEQRRIVVKVEQLMALVDELETQLAASRATAANLLSALVAELTSSETVSNGSSASFGEGRNEEITYAVA